MDKTKNSEIKIEEGFIGQKMQILNTTEISKLTHNIFSQNLYFTAIGLYPRALSHERFRQSGCDEYILLYCTEGEGYIALENEFFTLKANTYIILLIIPNKVHQLFRCKVHQF